MNLRNYILLFFILCLLFPNNAFADGSAIKNGVHYDSANDLYFVDFNPGMVEKAWYASYRDSTFTTIETEREKTASESGFQYLDAFYFNCNVSYRAIFYSKSGEEVGRVKFTATEIKEPACDSGGNGNENDNGNGSDAGGVCDSCSVFNCPEWGDYMGKIDNIIAAIPSPPNWGKVANTFRDAIAPRIKSDLGDLLGRAPDLPSKPGKAPGVNDGNLKPPKGNVAPGLDDSGFSKDDIKNGAPEIGEREDPTGGFDILNPVDNLPSQDDFKENIPDEGSVEVPTVPEVDAEAPKPPKEPENPAPKPPEQDNPTPGAPKEPENQAPTPPEQDNPAPGAPEEPKNTAPTPGDTTGTAPTPNDDIGTAPTPTPGGNGGYPMPGGDNSTGPIPGADSSAAPLPGKDDSKAPIPGRK